MYTTDDLAFPADTHFEEKASNLTVNPSLPPLEAFISPQSLSVRPDSQIVL